MKLFLKTGLTFLFFMVAGSLSFAEEVRLHPLESFSVKYAHEGMMSGESTQQCRNWCNEMVTTVNQTMSMMGITQNTNQKTINKGEKIFNIDLDKGTVTEAANPMYETMVQAGKNNGDDPMAFAQQWMDALGYQATGNNRTILGENCQDYTSPELMNSTVCMTEDGLTLRMAMDMGSGMSSVQTAVEVKRDDPGEDADYVVPAGAQPAASTPDLQQIQEMLENLQNMQQ